VGAATMKRQDVHRPSVLDPADYAWVGAEDAHDGDQYSFEFDWERYTELTGQPELAGRDYRDGDGIAWDELTERRACCHCGQRRIRYWSFYLHVPTGKVVAVGSACAGKLSLDSREDIVRRHLIERNRTAKLLGAWREADPLNEQAYAELLAQEDAAGGSGGAGNDFVDSLLRYARKHGQLTEAQRDAVLRGIERRAQIAEERAAKDAEMGDPTPAPVVEGRQVITGRLLSTRSQEGYGGRDELKMLVLDDRGFKVWCTLPGVLVEQAFELACEAGLSDGGVAGALRAGLKIRVRFTATVERSRKDETFGFGKRPTKAGVLTETAG
jgi:hypothetical protein